MLYVYVFAGLIALGLVCAAVDHLFGWDMATFVGKAAGALWMLFLAVCLAGAVVALAVEISSTSGEDAPAPARGVEYQLPDDCDPSVSGGRC